MSLISQRNPGTSTNFFGVDGHGSTRLLTDIGGNVVNAFTYDAYGNLIASNTTAQTVYLYAGEQFDSDLGFYYLRARYMVQNTGRFWTIDTDEGNQNNPKSLDLYAYGEDNPVDNTNPSGNDIGDVLEVADILGSLDGFASTVRPITKKEHVSIIVTTVIRPPDIEAGVKTIHTVVVDDTGKIVPPIGQFIGPTPTTGVGPLIGTGTFRQTAYGRDRLVVVGMYVEAQSVLMPKKLSIRYQFQIKLDFSSRKGNLSGVNERYPSYNVVIKGNQVYDFQQQRISGLSGANPVGIDKDFTF